MIETTSLIKILTHLATNPEEWEIRKVSCRAALNSSGLVIAREEEDLFFVYVKGVRYSVGQYNSHKIEKAIAYALSIRDDKASVSAVDKAIEVKK